MASFKIFAAIFAMVLTIAAAAPWGWGHGHEHHVIHVPYHVHTVHHHHVKKIHVPVVKKVYVHSEPIHHHGWW